MAKETPGAKVKALREAAEYALHAPVHRRADLLRQLAEVEQQLKSRIREASEVGLTHRYIAGIVDIPHPTISRWVREARR